LLAFARNFSGSQFFLYSNPELDAMLEQARTTVDRLKRTETYCAISQHINREAIWFWTFQNTYYAIAKNKLKGLPSSTAELSMSPIPGSSSSTASGVESWLAERLGGIARSVSVQACSR
jgi:ABC-type transport system substrate-binding protein